MEHRSRESASREIAQRIASVIQEELRNHPRTTIAVSGGATPQRCYAHLCREPLPWSEVTITLTDERCVPDDHEDSNTRMLREALLKHHARNAVFAKPSEFTFEHPFTAVLLGMGADGHFASIFPDAPEREAALDLCLPPGVLAITTAASPYARETFNLKALTQTEHLMLLVFGEDKREVLQQPTGLPIEHLLKQTHAPVQVHWAP